MRNRLAHVVIAVALAASVATIEAAAQERRPRIVSRPAGPGTIVGVVADTAANPIEGVEVTLLSPRRTTLTGRDGGFRFDELPNGRYDLRARRIGYDPQARAVRVGDDGGAVDFTLTPRPQALPTVVTSAVRGGLAGVVGDSARRPISNIEVRVLGKGRHVRTAPDGSFHFDLEAGTYVVQVTGFGYASRMVSVTIPRDSGRHVAIGLQRGETSNRQKINADDMAQRLAWRSSFSEVYGRQELQAKGDMSLEEIVRQAAPNPLDEACMALLDGGPERVPLWAYEAVDLEMVEVYPPGSVSVVGGRRPQPLVRGSGARGGAARVCPLVYIWRP
jgi:hypothetical protein